MRIGTTPTHNFTLPIDVSIVKDVEITYSKGETIILQKHGIDCQLKGNRISTTLTQEDTFMFNHKVDVKIQVRVIDLAGKVFASDVMKVDAKECLSKDVLA